jgi:Mn2+/Fe2+ NRAMP family transporter
VSIRQRLASARTRWLLLLSAIGPGIITTNVDNDMGGITTYSLAGPHLGYCLLWMLPPAWAIVGALVLTAILVVTTPFPHFV